MRVSCSSPTCQLKTGKVVLKPMVDGLSPSAAEWGAASFGRFRGMWAIMIFDSIRNEVILCRDRFGIKPLYLWQGLGIIAVASEIKQFLHVPGFVSLINLEVAAEYLQTGYPTGTGATHPV